MEQLNKPPGEQHVTTNQVSADDVDSVPETAQSVDILLSNWSESFTIDELTCAVPSYKISFAS